MAIATHSDAAQYDEAKRPRSKYIIGSELAQRVVQHAAPELAEEFKIVAFHPGYHPDHSGLESSSGKKYHMRAIAR